MPSPRMRDDELERLSRLEEEVRRLRLHSYGEGSGGVSPVACKVWWDHNIGPLELGFHFNTVDFDTTGGTAWGLDLYRECLFFPEAGQYLIVADAQASGGYVSYTIVHKQSIAAGESV